MCKFKQNIEVENEHGQKIEQVIETVEETPIHYAAKLNRIEIVKYLLSNFPKLISLKNSEGDNVVNLIVGAGNLEILQTLLESCAKADLQKVAASLGCDKALDVIIGIYGLDKLFELIKQKKQC